MTASMIFTNLRIVIIKSIRLDEEEIKEIANTAKQNGALDCIVFDSTKNSVKITGEQESRECDFDKEQFLSEFTEPIHCIVSNTTEFPFYRVAAFDFLIPVVDSKWVRHCIQFNRLMRTTCYSPNPIHFLKDCYVYVSKHALNEVEFQFYCAIVTVFGGTCMDYLSTKVTHIITWDKSDVAIKAMLKFHKYKVIYLFPNWLVDCLQKVEHLKEDAYTIDIHESESKLKERCDELWKKTLDSIGEWKPVPNFKLDKRVILGDDISLPGTSYKFLLNWIKKCLGGTVSIVADASQLKSSDADIYLAYHEDNQGAERANDCGMLTANIPWLFYVWQMQKFIHPMSKLLLSPIKRPVFTKNELKATFTNYYGEQRYYIQVLVEALGGICSTELTKKNTHLISPIAHGKKYEAASAWENCVKINHLWLESCYKEGKKMDPLSTVFQQYPPEGGLKTSLGQMSLIEVSDDASKRQMTVEEECFQDSQPQMKEEVVAVFDTSMADIPPAPPAPLDDPNNSIKESLGHIQGLSSPNTKDVEKPDIENDGEDELLDKIALATPAKDKDISVKPSLPGSDNSSQSLTPSSTNKRKAAAKAAEKLHTDIESLNEFQRITKRRGSPELLPESIQDLKKHKALEAKAEEAVGYLSKPRKNYKIRAVLTNCHENLSDLDILVLSKVGILITPEVDSNSNTIIAPKKARTAKFLKSFSFKPLRYALMPSFITDILSYIKREKPIDVQLENYYIPDIDPQVLEKTRLGTKVFARHGISHVNISDDIPGGTKLISSILQSHGMEEVKPLGKKFKFDDLAENNAKKKSPDFILIASKASVAKKFNKCVKDFDKSKTVLVVEWNWCVKSIFNLDLDLSDHEYVIYNK